jgi:D-alanine-D-alanine ligase
MRLDSQGNLYILEVNSLPSLGEHGSYVAAAEHMGMDFLTLVNRLVDVASARYFGTPSPPEVTGSKELPDKAAFSYLTHRRDQMEKQVQHWCQISSRTNDPIGIQTAYNELDKKLSELGLKQSPEYSDDPHVWVWQTPAGLEKGTLLIGQLDVPLDIGISTEPFRRDPECLHGEGVGSSRAPLVMLEYTLKALKSCRQLKNLHLGIMYYADEGNDSRYSSETISKVAGLAKQVLVLNAGNIDDKIVTKRRGQRKYRLTVEGKSLKLGQSSKTPDMMLWLFRKLEEISKLSSSKDRIAIAAVDFHTKSFPMLLPHRITTTLQMSFPDIKSANKIEESIREILNDKSVRWNLAMLSNRPSMKDRRVNTRMINSLQSVADKWEIPLGREASLIPSVAGVVPANIPVVCGIGPVATNIHTSQSAVQRISLVQRTLLLTEFFLKTIEK